MLIVCLFCPPAQNALAPGQTLTFSNCVTAPERIPQTLREGFHEDEGYPDLKADLFNHFCYLYVNSFFTHFRDSGKVRVPMPTLMSGLNDDNEAHVSIFLGP